MTRKNPDSARRRLDELIRVFPLERLVYDESLSQDWFEVAAEWELVSDALVGNMSNHEGDMRGSLALLKALRDMILEAPSGDLRQNSLQALDELVTWVTHADHLG